MRKKKKKKKKKTVPQESFGALFPEGPLVPSKEVLRPLFTPPTAILGRYQGTLWVSSKERRGIFRCLRRLPQRLLAGLRWHADAPHRGGAAGSTFSLFFSREPSRGARRGKGGLKMGLRGGVATLVNVGRPNGFLGASNREAEGNAINNFRGPRKKEKNKNQHRHLIWSCSTLHNWVCAGLEIPLFEVGRT